MTNHIFNASALKLKFVIASQDLCCIESVSPISVAARGLESIQDVCIKSIEFQGSLSSSQAQRTQLSAAKAYQNARSSLTDEPLYRLGPFPAAAACLAFILLNASSPLAPNGLANMPPATCPLLGTMV